MAYPESFLEMGVRGSGGKEPEMGDSLGDGGELRLVVELVEGRSQVRSFFACRKALNTGALGRVFDAFSPKEVEFRLAYWASPVVKAELLKVEAFSHEKASYGNASMAYAGGPTGTPYRL